MIKLRKNLALSFFVLMFSVNVSALNMDMKTEDIQSLDLSVEIPNKFTLLPEKLAEIKYPSKKKTSGYLR